MNFGLSDGLAKEFLQMQKKECNDKAVKRKEAGSSCYFQIPFKKHFWNRQHAVFKGFIEVRYLVKTKILHPDSLQLQPPHESAK